MIAELIATRTRLRSRVVRAVIVGDVAVLYTDFDGVTVDPSGRHVDVGHRVATEADGRGLKEVDEPRLYATSHASPQPFLPELAGLDWHPAQRLAPYRPRRPRRNEGKQERLVVPEPDAATG